MTPTLNPDHAPWTCVVAGTGITCHGDFAESHAEEPTDLTCEGRMVYVTGGQKSGFDRWHDLAGRAVETSIQTNLRDHLTFSPTGQGAEVVLSGGWHKHYVYPVAGDLHQRILTETGADTMLRAPGAGGGLLFQDSGKVTYAPDDEYADPVVSHGVHQLYDGSPPVEAAICDALLALG